MQPVGYRANALATFAVTILALMCSIVSVSDNFNSPSPTFQVQASLALNISADLQSLFTWNTKQVFVFVAAEYETTKNALNQGSNLRGKEFNLTLHWHVMPKTGKMFADKIVTRGYQLPEAYR